MTTRPSFRERVGLKSKKNRNVIAPDEPPASASSLLAPDSWVWELASAVSVSSSGVAGGSLAAKAVAAASASMPGTALATTLASPVGLCLVASCAVVGGTVLVGKSVLFQRGASVSEHAWVLVEAREETEGERFAVAVLDEEKAARRAFKRSRAKSKALFGPQRALVLSRQWQEAFRQVVAAL